MYVRIHTFMIMYPPIVTMKCLNYYACHCNKAHSMQRIADMYVATSVVVVVDDDDGDNDDDEIIFVVLLQSSFCCSLWLSYWATHVVTGVGSIVDCVVSEHIGTKDCDVVDTIFTEEKAGLVVDVTKLLLHTTLCICCCGNWTWGCNAPICACCACCWIMVEHKGETIWCWYANNIALVCFEAESLLSTI